MSEAVPECLVLAGLVLVLAWPFGAGLCAGVAIGLKLTFAAYAPGLAAALLAAGRWRSAPALAVGVALGAAAVAGPWCWELWRHTGNPVFPYFNDAFRSACAPAAAMTDTRFLPSDALHALLFPLFWTFQPSRLVSELPVCDPRLALAWAGWLVVLGRAAWRREAPAVPVRALLAFWVVAFVAWEARFSILRYAATLEVLAGIPVLLAIAPSRAQPPPARHALGPAFGRTRGGGGMSSSPPPLAGGGRGEGTLWRLALPVALAALVASTTTYPDWGRASPGPLAADVEPPAFPDNNLVLLLDPAPMAYVAAFSPPGVRFAGVNSNLLRPGDDTVLARAAVAAVAGHEGPLWGLESPRDQRQGRPTAPWPPTAWRAGTARVCARIWTWTRSAPAGWCDFSARRPPPPAAPARRARH
jgi:hypothetical protein